MVAKESGCDGGDSQVGMTKIAPLSDGKKKKHEMRRGKEWHKAWCSLVFTMLK